jgi:hypothetical protein
MPISFKYKAIFLHNPKTGGTSIESLLEIAGTKENLLCGDYENCDYALQHIPYEGLKEMINPDVFNIYFKFTFVRNPWDRLVSTYHWSTRGYPTFTDFVNFIDKLFTKYKDNNLEAYPEYNKHCASHYLPQYLYTGDDVKIYRFEDFNNGVKDLCKHLGITTQVKHINLGKHKHYSCYYTDDLIKIVARVYAEDIKRFGYTFERP